MAAELSSRIEQHLASMVAGGLFPSQDAALEAAIDALCDKFEPIVDAPAEHMERLEQAIESANAGNTKPFTPEYWNNLRQKIRDAATHGS
jgi:hypothetical protein